MKYTLSNLVALLLRKNRISFDKEELYFQIESHPSYPSLHAITGVLDHFNIENVAAKVPATQETLEQLPACYLAQIDKNNSQQLVIIEKNKGNYIINNEEGKKTILSKEEFLKIFTGIIVAVEKTEDISSSIKPSKSKYVFSVLSVLLGLTVLVYLFFTKPEYSTIIHLMLSITGIIISIAILKQEFGLETTIGNAFCSDINEKKDCDAVLTSKGAEIIYGYKLSDFSIIYFSILSLFTFFHINSPSLSNFISLLAAPITIYSIYYQYVTIKKWCVLCISIVGILWIQALIALLTNNYNISSNYHTNINLIILTLSFLLAWHIIKPVIINSISLKKDKIAANKFKRNFSLFEAILDKSQLLTTSISQNKEIVFGNINAPIEIVIITNPFCGHCKPVHKLIKEILTKHSEMARIITRFNINPSDLESDIVHVTGRLLEIYHESSSENCLLAMNDIYSENNPISSWFEKWGRSNHIYIEELEKENKWCKENAINFTPEILINGKAYPKEYDRSDLIFFIEDLQEKFIIVE